MPPHLKKKQMVEAAAKTGNTLGTIGGSQETDKILSNRGEQKGMAVPGNFPAECAAAKVGVPGATLKEPAVSAAIARMGEKKAGAVEMEMGRDWDLAAAKPVAEPKSASHAIMGKEGLNAVPTKGRAPVKKPNGSKHVKADEWEMVEDEMMGDDYVLVPDV
ncbi:hypothetical protein LTR36_000456 [Oleoguttula mirabilis]|uniref:Uncharacterized protein n=1 Tax=Oleoguttula mirabilis TaxID=1507867 RepID=A0AAV9JYK7_9PEZI|nr:hypothetical protein LTR36_000456 [Oleoguttula mirabilis]